jgi:hypothetical protein
VKLMHGGARRGSVRSSWLLAEGRTDSQTASAFGYSPSTFVMRSARP